MAETERGSDDKTISMSRDEGVFWIGLTVFGVGLYFVTDASHLVYGWGMTMVGICGLAWSLRRHVPHAGVAFRSVVFVLAVISTLGVGGYSIYSRNLVTGDRLASEYRPPSAEEVASDLAPKIVDALKNAPPDVFRLIASLRSQLNDADSKLQSAEGQVAETQQALDIARKPPLNPKVVPTWLDLNFDADGAPSETKSTNIHWRSWSGALAISCSPFSGAATFGSGGTYGLTATCSTPVTVVFLSFDSPITYQHISLATAQTIPDWKVAAQDEKSATVVINGKITDASVSIDVIR